jgi:hypothetical protein
MLKKPFIVIIFLCSVVSLFSQDGLFHILEDVPIWMISERSFMIPKTDLTATRILNKGSAISNVSPPVLNEVNRVPSFIHSFALGNSEYYIVANKFMALDTEEIFDESFLTSANPQANIWINAYFLDAMRTGNRNILIPYEQRQVDYSMRYVQGWYEWGDFAQSLVVTQGTISIGGLSRDQFLIQRINRIPNGYCVRVIWNTYGNDYMLTRDSSLRSMKVNLPERKKDPFLDLYFIIDGDYLDVYYSTGSERIYCSTFARVDFEIRRQINGIIRYNPHSRLPVPYDPSKITFWPRRADSSMDYPPPPGAGVSSNMPRQER